MKRTQNDGGTKVHLSSVAINVNSHRGTMVFIKSECVKTESVHSLMCVHMLAVQRRQHSVAKHQHSLAGFTRYLH